LGSIVLRQLVRCWLRLSYKTYNQPLIICEGVIKAMKISMTTWTCSCSDLVDVPRIVIEMIWASCLASCLMQLVAK